MNEHLMDDEQFLAHQMRLARVGDDVDMGMDENFEDSDDLELRAIHANHIPNMPIVNHAPNQVMVQDVHQNARPVNEDGNELGNRGALRLGNPVDGQGNNQAGNLRIAQDNVQNGNQNAGQVNNLGDNQAGHQGDNQHDNNVAGQHNGQVINQDVGRGNQIRFQPVHRAYNNAAAGGANRAFAQQNVGFGNFFQAKPLIQQGVLQPYPQGHSVFGHQQNLDQNIRYPSGSRRQRLLTPIEATRAIRLKSIIDNLEYELQRNREVYRRLYGPIPGGQNHDAGYWKNKFFQEKKRNSNRGKNLYFFNSK